MTTETPTPTPYTPASDAPMPPVPEGVAPTDLTVTESTATDRIADWLDTQSLPPFAGGPDRPDLDALIAASSPWLGTAPLALAIVALTVATVTVAWVIVRRFRGINTDTEEV